jgi:hypothetical protein
VFIEEEDDEEVHRPKTGLPQLFPVLLDENDDLMVEDIERIVNNALTADNGTKSAFQARKELEEVDEFIQEFSRAKWPQSFMSDEAEQKFRPQRKVDSNWINEVLMAVMEDHAAKVSVIGTLTEEDVPRLHEEWKKSCKDIMQGAPDHLPPLRDINHQIPIIDESKQYKYHNPRCPDSLRPELMEKIA